MDKMTSLVIFAAFFALTCSFPSEDRGEKSEDAELVTRNTLNCEELGLLKHYAVNLKTSHIKCSSQTKKRAANLLAREFKKREYDYGMNRYDRDFSACCSPDCDWLLDYLEIDSTVVKCLDRK
ncbi:hypothetical protein OS493_003923 [Desmophyllum pertusum]|uniref:Uncharacterized protein n=1 Tax=Desmophyllum pertusum TaxID=174260 RepID=A0A9W9ZSE3_9CNID|nr:hypothetical protein OS493_003923 [Desmophyllum pertusum]